MSSRVAAYIRQHHLGLVAIFLALSGTAYATHPGGANTIDSTDIIDGEIKTQDVRDGNMTRDDIRTDAVVTEHIATGAVQSIDVLDNSLTGGDIADTSTLGTAEINEGNLFNDNSLDASDVSNASTLGAAEINEAGLGTVPFATNASKVAGNEVSVVNLTTPNGSNLHSFPGMGALSIEVRCSRTDFGQAEGDLDLIATTDFNNATLAVSDDDSYADLEDFDISEPANLETLIGADTDEIINLVYVGPKPVGGLAPVVSGQLHILDAGGGATPECVVAGHLIGRD